MVTLAVDKGISNENKRNNKARQQPNNESQLPVHFYTYILNRHGRHTMTHTTFDNAGTDNDVSHNTRSVTNSMNELTIIHTLSLDRQTYSHARAYPVSGCDRLGEVRSD